MSNSKELSKLYVDNQVVRIIAAQVLIIALMSLLFNSIFPAFLLVVDFALRAFTQQPSPLATIAKITADSLKIKSQPIFAAPKNLQHQ